MLAAEIVAVSMMPAGRDHGETSRPHPLALIAAAADSSRALRCGPRTWRDDSVSDASSPGAQRGST